MARCLIKDNTDTLKLLDYASYLKLVLDKNISIPVILINNWKKAYSLIFDINTQYIYAHLHT
jgi:hypothetical protein